MKRIDINQAVYRVLQMGMYCSSVLFLLGVIEALRHPGYVSLDPSWILHYYHWQTFITGLRHGDPTCLMMLGTIALILTPVSRVAVSLLAFWSEGDKRYVGITGMVLGVIALTVVLAGLGLR